MAASACSTRPVVVFSPTDGDISSNIKTGEKAGRGESSFISSSAGTREAGRILVTDMLDIVEEAEWVEESDEEREGRDDSCRCVDDRDGRNGGS